MADEVEVVIAATQQQWAGRLVEWITDHGGAVRVRRHYCVTRDEALTDDYDVLVAEADSSLLDQALVRQLQHTQRTIVGVSDPQQPHTPARLAELGVDRAVDATDDPAEILEVIEEVADTRDRFADLVDGLGLDDVDQTGLPGHEPRSSILTVVTGALEGTGATEVAVETAARLRRRNQTVALVDADVVAPSLATRLQTSLTPNLNGAIGAVRHGLGDLADTLLPVRRGGFDLVAGLEHPKRWGDLDADAVVDVCHALAGGRQQVVVNLASQLEDIPRHAVTRTVLAHADQVVCTCEPTPVGMVRLCRWLDAATDLISSARMRIVANRAGPREAQAQFERELLRTVRVADITHLPADEHVAKAAWAGELVRRGPWLRRMRRFARGLPKASAGKRRKEPAQ